MTGLVNTLRRRGDAMLEILSDVPALLAPHILNSDDFTKSGYVQTPLDLKALESWVRCRRCLRKGSQIKSGRVRAPIDLQKSATAGPMNNGRHDSKETVRPHQSEIKVKSAPTSTPTSAPRPAASNEACYYHSGVYRLIAGLNRKLWSCCQQQQNANPCQKADKHDFPHIARNQLERNYQYFPTPTTNTSSSECAAVALDCEMGQSKEGNPELISLSMIDATTGKILVDSLVYPTVQMDHFNTKYSGVTRVAMNSARSKGQCIVGRDAARKLIWEFVGPTTIVILHGGSSDMSVLRWIHPRVVDTNAIVLKHNGIHDAKVKVAEKAQEDANSAASQGQPVERAKETREQMQARVKARNAARPFPSCSLKSLTKQLLGREIQGKAHSSLEDARATWEVAMSLAKMSN